MKFFRWLYPGIGIKRWVVLAAFGLGLMVIVGFSAVKTISQHSVLLASFACAVIFFGIFLVYTALNNIVRIFVRALMPVPSEDLANVVYQSRKRDFLARGPRVVCDVLKRGDGYVWKTAPSFVGRSWADRGGSAVCRVSGELGLREGRAKSQARDGREDRGDRTQSSHADRQSSRAARPQDW